MKRIVLIVAALLAGALFMQSCAISTASIDNVRICDRLDGDECAEDMQEIPASVTTIYLSAQLHDAVEGTEVTYTLSDLGSGEELITDSWTTEEGGSGPFSLSWNRPAAGWVTGRYELVLSLGTDNSEPISKVFELR